MPHPSRSLTLTKSPPRRRRRAQDCSWIGPPYQVCTDTERYPGLWEVPMWDLQANPTNSEGAFTMDPEGDVYAYLLKNFKWTYEVQRGLWLLLCGGCGVIMLAVVLLLLCYGRLGGWGALGGWLKAAG